MFFCLMFFLLDSSTFVLDIFSLFFILNLLVFCHLHNAFICLIYHSIIKFLHMRVIREESVCIERLNYQAYCKMEKKNIALYSR